MRVATRRFVAAAIGAGCSLWVVTSLRADTRVLAMVKGQGGAAPIAIDPSGVPHAAFQSRDYHLHHAWLDGRRWRSELVDGASDCGWGSSIAAGPGGEIHIAYYAERRDPVRGRLVHALFSGGAWQTTDLEVSGRNTRLALDGAGRPRILYEDDQGVLGYARFDGAAWSLESTGLGSSPYVTGLALDGEGHAHVSYAINYQGYFYATDAPGAWTPTQLGLTDSAPTAIALDSQGRVILAAAEGGTLRIHRRQGEEWSVEELPDLGSMGVTIDGLALALDASDRAHLLLGAHVSAGERGVEVALYASEAGAGWNLLLVDPRNAGYSPSLAFDAAGIAHGTYAAGAGRLTYVRVALPDLRIEWDAASATQMKGSTRITGRLTIHNQGIGAAGRTAIALVLSDDDVLDDGDTALPRLLRAGSLKPGQSSVVSVNVRTTEAAAGKRLFAVLVPDVKTGDLDLDNNTAGTVLAE